MIGGICVLGDEKREGKVVLLRVFITEILNSRE